ncbi:tetraspanin-17 isoform X2 [Musca domestica]|uniref:Tetraspanin n=1 Tax=Musca domestica TaxID=7370 RepID=A0A1I8MY80_MUSDO|nr:tetraspanin-17 isoform X2 [Musca domestica]
MPVRKYRHETREVSCCTKYLLFVCNTLLWMTGLIILAAGVWAWNEKDAFSNQFKLTLLVLDPAFVLICTGSVAFLIGFTGSVGALRENTCLLGTFIVLMCVLLVVEVCFGVLYLVLKDKGWIKDQATEGLRAFIIHYREDPDQQNLIDWIQEDWLQCCGIEGPKDWDSNNYFNCSSSAIGSREACGVPFSCCRRQPHELIKNKQCGYDVRKEGYPVDRHIYERGCLRAGEEFLEMHIVSIWIYIMVTVFCQSFEIAKIIYDKGCVQAGEEWMERNLILISTSAIIAIFFQILFVIFTQNLRADINSQKSKWH